MKIIDGKAIANEILDNIRFELEGESFDNRPSLYIIAATRDNAAIRYAELKQKAAESVGIRCEVVHMGEKSTPKEITDLIHKISAPQTKFPYGIMVQLPLYDHLKSSQLKILNAIPAEHDVDGLTAVNIGKVVQGTKDAVYPATVKAIIKSLNLPAKNNLEEFLKGKTVTIVNNSDLIGKPLSAVLSSYGATVTICNIHTPDLKQHTVNADIVVSATGKTNLIDSDMIKPDSILIDVTSQSSGNKVIGDIIRSKALDDKAGWITPVPGGIGPLTIASLFDNLMNLKRELS